jgi:hypothetical protein
LKKTGFLELTEPRRPNRLNLLGKSARIAPTWLSFGQNHQRAQPPNFPTIKSIITIPTSKITSKIEQVDRYTINGS